jgi:DNA polymerase III delta prime subunit
MNIAVHPTARHTLDTLSQDLPQSVLLSGPRGVGLLTVATWLASTHLADIIRPRDSKEHINSQNGSISVEMIRKLYSQTRTKHTSRHIIIIDDAERMSHGAQSAFLKLLEEPNSHIHFILTSHYPQKLLPTIHSRVQHTTVQPLDRQASANFIDALGVTDTTKRSQLRYIADGLPAELIRLAGDEAYFKARAEIIGDARDFLQADTYKKMLIIQKYRSNRDKALELVMSAMQLLRYSINAHPQPVLITQLKLLLDIQEHIASNHNISLQLTQFVI